MKAESNLFMRFPFPSTLVVAPPVAPPAGRQWQYLPPLHRRGSVGESPRHSGHGGLADSRCIGCDFNLVISAVKSTITGTEPPFSDNIRQFL